MLPLSRLFAVVLLSGMPVWIPEAAQAADSVQFTLKLTMQQHTCDVGLITPSSIAFRALTARDLMNAPAGAITLAGAQTVTLGLTNCSGSNKEGAVPAIQIQGNTPVTNNTILFRDDNSTARGNIGFGIRYQPTGGGLSDYLTSGSYVDLAPAGSDVPDQNMNFLVDMQYGPLTGELPTAGSVRAQIRFVFTYH